MSEAHDSAFWIDALSGLRTTTAPAEDHDLPAADDADFWINALSASPKD